MVNGEAQSGVRIWPDSTCLMSELVAELCHWPIDAWPTLTVLLPNQRLGRWLTAALSEHVPAFIPPRIETFDDFVGAGDVRALDAIETELLLADLVRTGNYKHIRTGHEHEIAQLDSEFAAWAIDDPAARLEQVIADEGIRSDSARTALAARGQELGDVLARFGAALATRRVTTKARAKAVASRALAERLNKHGLTAAWTYVVGLTSRTAVDAPLLQHLAQAPRCSIWLNPPPAGADAKNPLKALHGWLGTTPLEWRMTDTPASPPPTRTFAVRQAGGIQAEVTAALDLASKAIAAGCPASQVALVVANEEAYGKLLRQNVARLGLDANLAIATPLAETTLGRWLTTFINLAAQDEAVELITAFGGDPLTRSWFRHAHRAEPPTRATLGHAVVKSEVPYGMRYVAATRRLAPSVKAYLTAQMELLAPMAQLFKPGSRPSLSRWLSAFEAVLQPIVAEAERRDEAMAQRGMSQSARTAYEDFLTSLRRAEPSMPLAPHDFLSLIRRALLAQDVRSVGDQLSGMQIISISEARYLPLALVVVLGAVEGDFPRRLPQDLLLDNYFKTRLGLPGWQAAEAIEDTTFRLLKARLPVLVLSFPERRANEQTVRSRFIERALLEDSTLTVTSWNDALQFAPIGYTGTVPSPTRPKSVVGRVPGSVSTLTERLSATSMGHFLTCPYRFLLKRLDVEALSFVGEDDNRAEGQWLHAVLEAFFTSFYDGEEVAPPFDTSIGWDAFATYAEARLAQVTSALAPPHVKDTPLSLQLTHVAWPAFARHLMKLYADATPAAMVSGYREMKFGKVAPAESATVTLAGTTHGIDGKIDSVDRIPQGDGVLHVITDYKRRGVQSGGKVAAGLAPQLPLYALSLAASRNVPLAEMIIGYWSIIDGAWTGVAAGTQVASLAKERKLATRKETLEAVCDATAALWAWRRDDVTAEGAYGPDPTDCKFCDYAGICRKDDPELGAGVRARNALLRRRQGEGVDPAAFGDADGGGGK